MINFSKSFIKYDLFIFSQLLLEWLWLVVDSLTMLLVDQLEVRRKHNLVTPLHLVLVIELRVVISVITSPAVLPVDDMLLSDISLGSQSVKVSQIAHIIIF